MANPFDKFTTKTKTIKVKALGGVGVEVREPTINEVSSFYKLLTDESGKVVSSNFLEAKIHRVAECMVSPVMTYDELKALSSSASEALSEIYEAIESLVEKVEGN